MYLLILRYDVTVDYVLILGSGYSPMPDCWYKKEAQSAYTSAFKVERLMSVWVGYAKIFHHQCTCIKPTDHLPSSNRVHRIENFVIHH